MGFQRDIFGFSVYPSIEADLDSMFGWLESSGLTRMGRSYQDMTNGMEGVFPDESLVVGVPSSRASKNSAEDLERILKGHRERMTVELQDNARSWGPFWKELQNPRDAVRNLNIMRLPADAMAFYRPFHFPPFEDWGIYLIAESLLDYLGHLSESLGRLKVFTPSTLMTAVVFEIFHHEFFHHLVEATATALEIVSSGLGSPRAIYLDYRYGRFELEMGRHADDPLEEALANAYAYNSLSFIQRVRKGYAGQLVKLYQAAVERVWTQEPPGYRAAGSYLKGQHLLGSSQLIAMMMGSRTALLDLPLPILARHVFPHGHMAFKAKPDIPTYIVGKPEHIAKLYELVPAPIEAYTNLFWPGNTVSIDQKIAAEKAKEKEARKVKRGSQ